MSKNKANSRAQQSKSAARNAVKTPAKSNRRSGLNDARETRKFFTILGICTLLLTFLLYMIFMRSSR